MSELPSAAPRRTLQHYARLKAELLALLREMGAQHPALLASCTELADKLATERFNLLTVGEFKRGKTSLVNALLGEPLLPTGVTPLTSVSTVLGYGATFAAKVHYRDGAQHAIDRADIAAYVTETGNPGNLKGVQEVRVQWPAPLLRDGLHLVDTPGVGSIHRHNTDAVHALLPGCDAALFVLSADQPLGQAEIDFLGEVRAHARRIFFVLNKIDYLENQELTDTLRFTQEALDRLMAGTVRLFPVAARLALKGGTWVDAGLYERSGLSGLIQALEAFLLKEKGWVLLRTSLSAAARLLDQARLAAAILEASLTAPPEVLAARLEAFREAQARSSTALERLFEDFAVRSAVPVTACLDPAIRHWKHQHLQALEAAFNTHVRKHEQLSPAALDSVLSGYIIDKVGVAISHLNLQVEPVLAREFEAACRFLDAGVTALMDELQTFAANLFELKPPAAASRAAGLASSTWQGITLDTDPAGLSLLSEWLVTQWPAYLGQHFPRLEERLRCWSRQRIARRRWHDFEDCLDQALGRLRFELLMHLEAAQLRYTKTVRRWHEETATGILAALQAGLTESQGSAAAQRQTREALARQVNLLMAQEERLTALGDSLESYSGRP